MYKRSTVLTLCAGIALLIGGYAQAVVIDDFEDGSFHVNSLANNFPLQSGLGAHTLTGGRKPGLEAGLTAGASVSLNLLAGADNGATLLVPAGARAAWTTIYVDPMYFAPQDLDLTSDGDNGLLFTVASAPATGYRIGAFVANMPTPGQRASLWIDVTGPGQYALPYSQFQPRPGEQMPDFESVDVLYTYVECPPPALSVASSFTVTDVRTAKVPEPSLSAVAAAVMFLVRRRAVRNRDE